MYNTLSSDEEKIIVEKATEHPFTGEYDNFFLPGTFICRRCNTPLYQSNSKFHSGCGWPSFDASFPGAVQETVDSDGVRTEITCKHYEAHLGHVFRGEKLTEKDTRHCVNSLSMRFIPEGQNIPEQLSK